MEHLPPEVVLKVLSQLNGKTLMVSIPQVCKRWRAMCQEIRNVHLEFSWVNARVPVEVLDGWRQTSLMSRGRGRRIGWKTGLCELFPRSASITMGSRQGVEDAHLMAVADKCQVS